MSSDQERTVPGAGTILRLPYDWRPPMWARINQRAWNPRDRHLLTPKSFGWGYDVNIYQLLARMGIVRRR